MPSKVDIANWALAVIGDDEVDSLTEVSEPARKCRRFYPLVLKAMLGEADWAFGIKEVPLALSGTTPNSWLYRYSLPDDCIKAISIVTSLDEDIAYEVVADKKLDTDEPSAVLRYVSYEDDPNKYTDQFVEALVYKLALAIDVPLTTGVNVDKLTKLYNFYIKKAKTSNKTARRVARKTPEQISDFLKARL